MTFFPSSKLNEAAQLSGFIERRRKLTATKLVTTLARQAGLELEVRDDPMLRLDEFRLMSRPAGRDVTELYAVA